MATNPPKDDNHRNGAVRDRSQVKNDLIDRCGSREIGQTVGSSRRRMTESPTKA
jgi:hypothetical protein